jgi:sugar fermentation stimulation protein A
VDTGVEVESHLADPGRLREILVAGARLYLDGPFSPPRKLRYSTVLAEQEGVLVNLVSALPNRVFPAMLERGLLTNLVAAGELVGLRREVRHGASRFDFEVTDGRGPILVECKGVGLRVGARALFPDAPSTRAVRHVSELEAHVADGGRAAVVFVAGRVDVACFSPARHIDPAFADALVSAAKAGVQLLAYSLRLELDGVYQGAQLEIEL